MNWKKIKIYSKLLGISLVVLVLLAFILSNREPTQVRFLWWQTPELPMYLFVLAVAACGILAFGIFRRVGHVVREYRLMRTTEKERQKLVAEVKQNVMENTESL